MIDVTSKIPSRQPRALLLTTRFSTVLQYSTGDMAEALRAMGTVAQYTVEKGQPHRLDTLAGDRAGRLFEGFEATQKGCSR